MKEYLIQVEYLESKKVFNNNKHRDTHLFLTDRLQHFSDCRHIIVIHQGRYFKFTCYKQGQLLEPCELEIGLEQILNDKSEPSPGEKHLAALTAGNRVPWAEVSI